MLKQPFKYKESCLSMTGLVFMLDWCLMVVCNYGILGHWTNNYPLMQWKEYYIEKFIRLYHAISHSIYVHSFYRYMPFCLVLTRQIYTCNLLLKGKGLAGCGKIIRAAN